MCVCVCIFKCVHVLCMSPGIHVYIRMDLYCIRRNLLIVKFSRKTIANHFAILFLKFGETRRLPETQPTYRICHLQICTDQNKKFLETLCSWSRGGPTSAGHWIM